MEYPPIETEIPRYEIERQIRRNLPRSNPNCDDLVAIYMALNQRDRAVVYRVALALAEHAGEIV